MTLIFTKILEKSKCKLSIILSIYSKDFIKCLHVELYSGSTKKFTNNNTKYVRMYVLPYFLSVL